MVQNLPAGQSHARDNFRNQNRTTVDGLEEMLFASGYFLLVIYPLILIVFLMLQKTSLGSLSLGWLALSSILLYAWWDPVSLPLLLASMMGNYALGNQIIRVPEPAQQRKTIFLMLGITLNLLALAYYKYLAFLANIAHPLLGFSHETPATPIPLGISFLTFLQIAYLVDVSRHTGVRTSFLYYSVFVTFFPKVIAGPITRLEQFFPQLHALEHPLHSTTLQVAEGVTVFAIGLFKKMVLADPIGLIADPIFGRLSDGTNISGMEAWIGVLAYTFQLYFDFSGYTDMAIGLARSFGICLPENFNSPYQATSIIDFWRRWHITFSSFLRDFLYIPLGGNRKGLLRQHANLFITMVLGGLWHGANWTFVIWGALHGAYLSVNHLWEKTSIVCPSWISRALTFFCVVFAWGWFRVDSIDGGQRLCRSLAGLNGVMPEGTNLAMFIKALETPAPSYDFLSSVFHDMGFAVSLGRWTIYPIDVLLSDVMLTIDLFAAAAIISFFCPATDSWVKSQGQLGRPWFTPGRAFVVGLLFYAAFVASIHAHQGSFIYRQF